MFKPLTYRCLHHQHPLFPQVADKLKDVDGVLCLYPLHHGVQCDEGACPTHTSTAVHQEEVLPAVRMCLPHSLDEVDHGDGIVWNTMVRPGQVVEQGDLKWWGVWLFTLKQTCWEFVQTQGCRFKSSRVHFSFKFSSLIFQRVFSLFICPAQIEKSLVFSVIPLQAFGLLGEATAWMMVLCFSLPLEEEGSGSYGMHAAQSHQLGS